MRMKRGSMHDVEHVISDSSALETIDFGILQEFADNPHTTDLVVTEDCRVWVDQGNGLVECFPKIPLRDSCVLRTYAVWLCAQLGKRLDDACPIADASSVSGIRVHAIIAPLVRQGAAISVRFPSRHPYDLNLLAKHGMVASALLPLLRGLVRQRANILITGSTGSGKTTLMKALLLAADLSDRVVSVEETRELAGVAQHHVSLSVREANVEGSGAIGLTQLVKATLRMRPDRIILGECRGEEIADLLRVFTSGHRGGMTTLHADTVQHVPARLMALGLLAGLQPAALAALAAGAFDVVIHVQRVHNERMIQEIGILQSTTSGLIGIPLVSVRQLGAKQDNQCSSKQLDIQSASLWQQFSQRWAL